MLSLWGSNMPDKGNLGEEGFALTHSLRIQSIRVEVSGEHEAAGHVVSVVRNQGVMNASAQLSCSFLFTSRPQHDAFQS